MVPFLLTYLPLTIMVTDIQCIYIYHLDKMVYLEYIQDIYVYTIWDDPPSQDVN